MAAALDFIPGPFRTVGDVLDGLTALESGFAQRKDKRAVFVGAYLLITQELSQRLQLGSFEDRDWVARYVVSFAELYRQALVD